MLSKESTAGMTARMDHPLLPDIMTYYLGAAESLAADRTTKSLPVAVAQLSFVLSYAFAFTKTFSAPLGEGNWWNVEVHSIGP